MAGRLRGLWCDQRGQSLLETAFMFIVIFMVVFWVFELGWLMYTYSVLADGAYEGVRHAVVRSGGDPTGTQNTVKAFAAASLHNLSAMAVSVTFPDGNAQPPNRVRVMVTYPYVPFLPNYIFAPTMHTYAEGRMVAQ
jgi:Flp pilus assembly protein TadG